MEKVIHRTYIVVSLALLILLGYYFLRYRINITTEEPKLGNELLNPVSSDAKQTGEDLISGEGWKGRIHIDGVTGKYCHLMFYTIHQTVEVFHGAERVYSMVPSPKNSFAKTPGCVWNDILITEDMNGADLYVILTPVYKDKSYGLPEFYLGEKGSIVLHMLEQEIFTVIISIILIITGSVMCWYVFYNRRNSEVDKDLVLLGLLQFLVGLWRVSDTALAKMLFHGLPIFSLLPFIAMMMVVVPFVLFLKDLYTTRDFMIWYIPCWVSLGVMGLALFLQFFNLVDFRQILMIILLSLGFAILTILYMTAREWKRNGWNAKLRRNLLGMMVVVLGVCMDTATYHFSHGKYVTSFVILGFLIYAIALGVTLFKESGALIVAGKGAHSMEMLAYHDKLTGTFNRAAFIVDTDPYAVDPENYVVVVLDLNNLKYCNDHLGHEMGDKYICDSAEIIRNTFGTIGSVYRMGGDEFYCLIPKGGKAACREQLLNMERMVEEYNKKSEIIKIGIACGYARYDNRIDFDLNATAKRADQLMYQNKEEMKKQ
ncbi:MAG: diguanylate cyclase [Lachnospiraceae bacterium]|nr:diguanylate cyclase [Lachnospiraceae bacterium]